MRDVQLKRKKRRKMSLVVYFNCSFKSFPVAKVQRHFQAVTGSHWGRARRY